MAVDGEGLDPAESDWPGIYCGTSIESGLFIVFILCSRPLVAGFDSWAVWPCRSLCLINLACRLRKASLLRLLILWTTLVRDLFRTGSLFSLVTIA